MPFTLGPRVAYGHIPSVAGTFSAALLEEHGVTGRDHCQIPGWCSHARLADMLPHAPGRFVIAGIREPAAWYLGRVHHSTCDVARDGSPDVIAREWGSTPLEVLSGLLDPKAAGLALDWTPEQRFWVPWRRSETPRQWCEDRGCGMLTWLFVHTYGREEVWGWSAEDLERDPWSWLLPDALVDAGQARAGLAEAVGRAGAMTPELAEDLTSRPKINAAADRPELQRWSGQILDYLSEQEIRRIYERDRLVAHVMGYRPHVMQEGAMDMETAEEEMGEPWLRFEPVPAVRFRADRGEE